MAFHEDTYQCNPMRFYFEASQFCPGAEWIRELWVPMYPQGFGLNGDVKRGLTVSPEETLRHSQALA